jgi:hypothetical protein
MMCYSLGVIFVPQLTNFIDKQIYSTEHYNKSKRIIISYAVSS